MRDIVDLKKFIVTKSIKMSAVLNLMDIYDSNPYINAAAMRLIASLLVYRHEKGLSDSEVYVLDDKTREFINKELEFLFHEYEGKL